MPGDARHLVLVGGGHSHLFVLEAFARMPQPGTRLTVVAPAPLSVYSGMIPGVLAGQYALRAAQIDVAIGRREAVEMRTADRRKDRLWPLPSHRGKVVAIDHVPYFASLILVHG